MKNVLIVFLASIVILTGFAPMVAFGENGYDKRLEELILKTKELFNITDAYDKFNSSVSSYDGNTQFFLNWSDSSEKLNNISVNIDINGNIISYSSYPSVYKEYDQKLPNISESEAEKIAMDFISKIAKDISKSIKLLPNNTPMSIWDSYYYFNYVRYENDIAYKQNTVNVSVNKFTGEVNTYYAIWDRDIDFPDPIDKISLENAKGAYKNQIGLKLIYKTNRYYPLVTDAKNESKYYLAYAPLFTNKAIDAFTGEAIPIDRYAIYLDAKDAVATEEAVRGSLTPAEMEAVEKLSGLLDEKAIEKKAREILKIDEGYELYSKNLYKDYKNPEDYNWSLFFQKQIDDNKYTYVDISLNAKTGELVYFYKATPINEDAKAQINRQEALELAKEYIKANQEEKFKEVELFEYENEKDNQLSYSFHFIRKSDGIYVEDDRIFVAVDAVNKEVYSYSISWYNGELPAADNIISEEKAYEILWNKVGLELNYIKTYDYSNPNNPKAEIKLVYSLNNDKSAVISAITGELLDYTGKPYREAKVFSYVDLENSYAKEKIETLGKYGIGFIDEEFKPKEKINQRDFIYLLWQSMNQYRINDLSDEDIYKEFISMGYIKEEEKNPDKIVTKEEAIKYIIRIMKLERIAELENIYKDIFLDSSDISEGLKGYMNIAYGLKILLGDGSGYIRPKYELKREDAANIIYNYMFN